MTRMLLMTAEEFTSFFCGRLESLGLSDEEAADLLDVPIPSVMRWRQGESAPHPVMQDFVVRSLGISLKPGEHKTGSFSTTLCAKKLLRPQTFRDPVSDEIQPHLVTSSMQSLLTESGIAENALEALEDGLVVTLSIKMEVDEITANADLRGK